jgi:deoxyhypusine synthase
MKGVIGWYLGRIMEQSHSHNNMPQSGHKHICQKNIIHHIKLSNHMTTNELVQQMGNAVMGAGRIAKATDVMERMFRDEECTVFLGVAGAMVPGGMKKVIIDLLQSGNINVFVTTGATLTHDMAEALGYTHHKGSPDVDDHKLNKENIYRMYDCFMPNVIYEGLEDFFEKNFAIISETETIPEFLTKVGLLLQCPAEQSILKTCAEKNIPIFCPALSDSGIGLMIWGQLAKGKQAKTKAFEDMKQMMDHAWESKKAGVIYIGGGVPKNYIQQAMQLAPTAATYGIQITTDRPEPGGSSGAPLQEGVSWGKMNVGADHVDVLCDATIALPLIYAAVKERLHTTSAETKNKEAVDQVNT